MILVLKLEQRKENERLNAESKKIIDKVGDFRCYPGENQTIRG
jgi:hypothetical protein